MPDFGVLLIEVSLFSPSFASLAIDFVKYWCYCLKGVNDDLARWSGTPFVYEVNSLCDRLCNELVLLDLFLELLVESETFVVLVSYYNDSFYNPIFLLPFSFWFRLIMAGASTSFLHDRVRLFETDEISFLFFDELQAYTNWRLQSMSSSCLGRRF